MTFLELYGIRLDTELASTDRTQLFTTARRKQAINDAQDHFARLTGATKRYNTTIPLVDGTAEYDLEASITDFIRLAGDPSIKIVKGSNTRYIQGKNLLQRTPEELDYQEGGWRVFPASSPMGWYERNDSGATYLGVTPPPDLGVGETWTWVIPYAADPPDMSTDADIPFTWSGNTYLKLVPYHQALVYYAASLLEPLRKNYTGADRQTKKYIGIVAEYQAALRSGGPHQIRFAHNYLQAASRSQPPGDPHR